MGEQNNNGHTPPIYLIEIDGLLDPRWSYRFDGMQCVTRRRDDGRAVTTLRGPVVDQAALRGILTQLWDLNLTVLAVRRSEGAVSRDRLAT